VPHPTIPRTGLCRPLSRSMDMLLAADDILVDNWCLHEQQPPGGLRNFLLRQYANAAEVEQAFNAAGGSIVVRATSGSAPATVGFRVDAGGHPTLALKGAHVPTMCEVRILLAEAARA
jgi:hypothetical protein